MFRPLHWAIIMSQTVPQRRLYIVNGHVINEISLDDTSYANTTLYSLL